MFAHIFSARSPEATHEVETCSHSTSGHDEKSFSIIYPHTTWDGLKLLLNLLSLLILLEHFVPYERMYVCYMYVIGNGCNQLDLII